MNSRDIDGAAGFTTAFVVRATIKSSLGLLEASLNEIPALKERSRGTRLTYTLLEIDGGKPKGVGEITFGSEEIAYSYRLDGGDNKIYAEELAKFLSIIAYVDRFYKIELSSIYKYLIEGLTRGRLFDTGDNGRPAPLVERVNILAGINLNISHELVKLRSEVALQGQEIISHKKRVAEVLEWISKNSPMHVKAVEEILGRRAERTDAKRVSRI